MKYVYNYSNGKLNNGDKEFFEKVNPGFKCTGETLIEEYEDLDGFDGGGCEYVVMSGRWTNYGMCRDCGDHYIIARWSRYDRIDKETFDVTFDVADK